MKLRKGLSWTAGLMLCGLAIGCKGADGAVGPQGPQGPQGPAGQTYITSVVVNSDGEAVAALPTQVGTNFNKPPAITCYVGNGEPQVWLPVSDGIGDDTVCGLAFGNGRFNAVIIGGPVGWTALFVVVY